MRVHVHSYVFMCSVCTRVSVWVCVICPMHTCRKTPFSWPDVSFWHRTGAGVVCVWGASVFSSKSGRGVCFAFKGILSAVVSRHHTAPITHKYTKRLD